MKSIKLKFRKLQLSVITNDISERTSIVFIHGNSMSGKIWQKQFDSELSRKYNLIAIDLPGFGDSSHSDDPGDYDVNALSDSLITVIEHFDLKEYIVVGHSLGGHIAVQAIDRLKNCKGLVSIAAPPIGKPAAVGEMFSAGDVITILFRNENTDEDITTVGQNFFHQSIGVPDFFVNDFKKSDGNARAVIGSVIAQGHYNDEIEAYNKNKIPVVFVSGEGEKAINNKYYNNLRIMKAWKKPLHLISKSTHTPQWENPAEFNSLLDTFILEHKNQFV